MNVWIFVISAVFTPVFEPLGLSEPAAEAPPAVTTTPVVAAPVLDDDMRYPGIERMFARLDEG